MDSLLFQELRSLSQSRFSGCLTVKNGDGQVINFVGNQTWQLFFYQGRMIGDSGGIHPLKRWQHFLQAEISKFPSEIDRILHQAIDHDTRSDQLMRQLLDKSILNYQNVQDFVANSLSEVLFDIYQHEIWTEAKKLNTALTIELSYHRQFITWKNLPDPAVVVPVDSLLKKLEADWQEWSAHNLMWYSPQMSPYLIDRMELQETMAPDAYLEMIQLIDGQKTFRDIAIELHKEPATLTTSLLNNKEKLSMEFAYVAAETYTSSPLVTSKTVTYQHIPDSSEISIVGAIIDGELDLYVMQQIALIADYGYVGMQDPEQAARLFASHCPQIIFLDAVLSNIDGYEACSNLRRIPQLKKIPIVLLTTSKKEENTIRAKMTGVTAFSPKPLVPAQIMSMIERYILHKF
jgi:two-component system, chemotaxis family, response regulator PixG